MPTTRCYNCGLPGHQTQDCPRFGPRFPAPGKTAQDYAADVDRIRGLIAQDILNEHNATEHDPEGDELDARRDARNAAKGSRRSRKKTAATAAGDSPPETGGPPSAA